MNTWLVRTIAYWLLLVFFYGLILAVQILWHMDFHFRHNFFSDFKLPTRCRRKILGFFFVAKQAKLYKWQSNLWNQKSDLAEIWTGSLFLHFIIISRDKPNFKICQKYPLNRLFFTAFPAYWANGFAGILRVFYFGWVIVTKMLEFFK